MMTRTKRRALFYALLVLFFLLGSGVVLYADGWRFNPETFQIKKIGAIYVQSYPSDAAIALNGKFVENKSGFFQNGTLIGNLFPLRYTLTLSHAGFQTWEENVSVRPSLVSEVKYAVLVPASSTAAATGTIRDFWLLDNTPLTERTDGKLYLNGKNIGTGAVAGFTSDTQNILTFDASSGNYALHQNDAATSTNIDLLLRKLKFDTTRKFSVSIEPHDKRMLLVRQNNKLFELNTERSTLTAIYDGTSTLGAVISPSQFYIAWTEWNEERNTSTLTIYDKFLGKTNSEYSDILGKNVQLEWLGDTKTLILLQDNGGLYSYDTTKGTLSKIADDVKNFSAAPDGSAIAALEHSSLEIFFLNRSYDNYYRFNLPDVASAEKLLWYADMNHLFVTYPGEVKFLDIQNPALDYFPVAARGRTPQYDAENNALYFLDGEHLEMLSFPK